MGNPAISPDGRYLVYSSWEDDRLTIWLRDIAEKTETRLVEPFSCWSFEDFRFARDGRAVYYSFQPEAGQASALYKVPLIGGDRRLIHAGVGSVAQLSPDEKRLALTAEKGGNDILSVADVESDQETEIGEIYRDASWSPDGSELLFFRQEEGKYGLFVVKPDGTAERRLGEFAQRPAGRAWRPHGEGVVFGLYSEEYEATRLYDLDLATGVTKPLGDRYFRQGYFSWLPDGWA